MSIFSALFAVGVMLMLPAAFSVWQHVTQGSCWDCRPRRRIAELEEAIAERDEVLAIVARRRARFAVGYTEWNQRSAEERELDEKLAALGLLAEPAVAP